MSSDLLVENMADSTHGVPDNDVISLAWRHHPPQNLQMGEPMEEKDVDEILGYADNNKDGKIDYEEFLELMMKCFEDAVTQVPPRSSGAG